MRIGTFCLYEREEAKASSRFAGNGQVLQYLKCSHAMCHETETMPPPLYVGDRYLTSTEPGGPWCSSRHDRKISRHETLELLERLEDLPWPIPQRGAVSYSNSADPALPLATVDWVLAKY